MFARAASIAVVLGVLTGTTACGSSDDASPAAPGGGNDAGGDDAGASDGASPDGDGDAAVRGDGAPSVTTFDTHCLYVPDPDVAASDSLVGTAIQWDAWFYKKDGTPDHSYHWAPLRGQLAGDTHIVFDASSQRWFVTTIVDLGGGTYGVQVMVSTDAAATDWKASIPATQTGLIDNPEPTVTSDKVVITDHGACVWALDKAPLFAGDAPVVPTSSCSLQSFDNVIAVKYGGAPPSTAYAVTLIDSTHLSFVTVDGTHATNDVAVKQRSITVPTVDDVPVFGGVTQNGMDIESGRVKAMWQAGHLVWGQAVKCPNGSCERIFDIDTAKVTATSHDFTLAGTQVWYGVPGLDRFGNTWVLMAEATKTGDVGLALAGVFASGSTYEPRVVVQGQSVLTGGNRFGDYFSAAQDPSDGSTWLIGQYAGPAGSPLNKENSAGCKVVHVTPQ